MPFEITDRRDVSATSNFFGDISFSPERNVGLQKLKSIHDNYPQGKSEMEASPGSILSASLPLKINAGIGFVMPQTSLSREITENQHFGGEEGIAGVLKDSQERLNYNPRSWSDVRMQPASGSYGLIGNKIITNVVSHESSLFSSSLSDIFSKKLRLSSNGALLDQPINVGSLHEEEAYKSLEEIEADTIGNLLPDEDDLFSGVDGELGGSAHARTSDDFEDFDLFSSGGGMELEGDAHLVSEKRTSCMSADLGHYNKGKHPFGEQSYRTLFVRNINSNVEDSELKALFEQYGDIRTMYTAGKHHGFVMISYYDLRAAQNAMKALQNMSLKSRNLDIHYSIPKGNAPDKDIGHGSLVISGLDSSVLNDELQNIFGFYGEIKGIFDSPEMDHIKFIEFYDVRAAEASLRGLNKIFIAGKQINLEPFHPRITACLLQQSQKGQDEPDIGHNLNGNLLVRQKATLSSGAASGGSLENGYNQGFQSATKLPLNAYIDNNTLFPVNSGIHKTARGASTGKSFGVCESSNAVDAMKFASIPGLHPHSLPEYHGSLPNGGPYNFSSTISNMAPSIGTGSAEVSGSMHIQGMGSTGNVAEFSARGNSSRPHGLYHMWNTSNLHQQHPSNAMLWPKTPSFVNGAGSPCIPQMPSFPGTPSHMLRATHVDHHVGSAPVVTASPWETQRSYLGESPEASGFRLGSLGSAGFHDPWQLQQPDFSSRNMFSHVGGNGTELMSNAGQGSPKQLSHVFPGRLPMTSMSKFDTINERMRNLYNRRSEANTNNADKKQFELDLSRILRGEDSRTTLMIKNIPNKYTSKMLLAAIDEQCRGTYDFLYLPIDFKNKCNVGYAFINMIDPAQIIPFHQAFHGKKWEKFNSEKVAVLAYARIQGKSTLVAHFQNSSLMNEDKRCRPILFHTDGPNAGDPEPFPLGNNIRLRPGKSRTSASEENRGQGNPSTSASGEESTNGIESSRNSD
ncbi:PREDICTED: protein MEI2-like 4 [Lupinus angustifolius]|uniref:protein MEI2-like 4 n=1 Tax=Lupinus angustifolius TaxID=3871 RepID=UPI00092F43EF|nr:PREDICTED: protein MEI2-like 4 [Lupinus angustifolius]XP_019414900.1 PREDICTED: protein MEI2-like 4 [Lupinus angustifolius]XP_019414901.1 PREDICTED: protein MEI2-like 4 [Lupinus angustifolius]